MTTGIAFIGGGNMARAIAGGLLAAPGADLDLVMVEPRAEARSALEAELGVATHAQSLPADGHFDAVVLAVKPQVMAAALAPHREYIVERRPLVLSIAAGIPIGRLQGWLDEACAIVRIMPNTPALVGLGAAGLFANANVSDVQRRLAETIMAAVGAAVWVEDERMIDVVTAVSGSGPAYVFAFIEALENAARQLGMDAATARSLAVQTALGAATLARDSSAAPSELRVQVTSPGGTTERALSILAAGGFEQLIAEAVQAAFDRAVELAENP